MTRSLPPHAANAVAFIEMTPPVAQVFAVLLRQVARYGIRELTHYVVAPVEARDDAETRARSLEDRAQSIAQATRELYTQAANAGYAVLTCTTDGWTNPGDGWSNRVRIAVAPLSDVERS
jgi:hypothetical protein